MAVLFFLASYINEDVTVGEAGRVLARMFAGALAIASAFTFMLGLVLLRDERGEMDHYVIPMVIGTLIGALASLLFLTLHFELLFLPFLLVIFVLRPVRRRVFPRRTARTAVR
jgi:hypothetical protein